MALTKMGFSPTTGLRDTVTYPKDPGDETAAREQVQGRLDEIKNFLNNTMTVEVDAHLVDVVTDIDGAHGLQIEEGNWTPTFVGSTTAGTNTYSEQVGRYYKIGKSVYISGRIALSAKDGTMAGNVRISGLPFTSESSGAMAGINIALASLFDLPAGYTQLSGRVTQNTNYIDMLLIGDNVANGAISVTNIGSTTAITFSAMYKIA